jgi:hypothetical protein
MRVTISLLGLFGGVLAIAACGEILSANEDPPVVSPANDGSPSESVDSATNPPPPSDGGSPVCLDVSLTPAADSCLYGCGGTNSQGTYPMCNVAIGPYIASFDLDPQIAKDVRDGLAKQIVLTLADNRTCDGDAGPDDCGNVGPEQGTLTAHVATNVWVEGAARAGYVGADECRRSAGQPGIGWGSTGAAPSNATKISSPADYSGDVGSVAIANDTGASVSIAIDPALSVAHWKTYAPAQSDGGLSNRITFVVRPGSTGRLVVGTRESKRVAPPKLTLTICK